MIPGYIYIEWPGTAGQSKYVSDFCSVQIQQNNVQYHRAKIVLGWFELHPEIFQGKKRICLK